MDNENEQVKREETETEGDTVKTPEEQKKKLIQAYLTSTMEEEETTEEQNKRRKLIHAYSKRTIDNDEEQTEQDEIDTYLRTSTEEYNEEPFEENDEDESSKENDDEGKWTTQFSYPTEEEENTLFIAFMTGNVEDQKTWINTNMNLTRTVTNEKTRRREEEILDRIIPTGIMDLEKILMRKKRTTSQNVELTILPEIKKKKIAHLLNQTNSLMKTQKRISNRWNLLTFPTEITRNKMKKPPIHYLRHPNSTTSL